MILKVKNITESFHTAGYYYQLYVNENMIQEGFVYDHKRADGYAALLREVAQAIEDKGNPKPKDVEP